MKIQPVLRSIITGEVKFSNEPDDAAKLAICRRIIDDEVTLMAPMGHPGS